MDSIPSPQETIHWFLAFPNNWATLFMLKSGFSTLAANSYKFLTGETLPEDCEVYDRTEPYFKSYSEIKHCKKFIVWRDPIDRCISIYNELKCNPRSHAALRGLVNLDSVHLFINCYTRCREVHTLTLTWYLDYIGLNPNEFLFVDIGKLEEFSRNELGVIGDWKVRNKNNSDELSESIKQLFRNSSVLKRHFHNDYLLYKNVQHY